MYDKRLGIISFVSYVILSIYSIVAYKILITVLEKHFHEELKKERQYLRKMFLVLTITFVVYAVFLLGWGNYWRIVC
jgi:hypothetical protein